MSSSNNGSEESNKHVCKQRSLRSNMLVDDIAVQKEVVSMSDRRGITWNEAIVLCSIKIYQLSFRSSWTIILVRSII